MLRSDLRSSMSRTSTSLSGQAERGGENLFVLGASRRTPRRSMRATRAGVSLSLSRPVPHHGVEQSRIAASARSESNSGIFGRAD